MKKHIEDLKNRTYNFLRWTEQWTGTDMIYLASGTFWIQTGKIVAMGLSFISSIAFANFLPQEIYGNYRYILSVFGFLTIFTLSGMDNVIINASARSHSDLALAAIKEKIKWGFGGLFLGLGISIYYLIMKNMVLAESLLIASVFTPFFDPLFSFNSIINGKKKFKLQTTYALIIRITTTLVLISTIYLSQNIVLITLIYFVSNFFLRIIFFRKTIKNVLNQDLEIKSLNSKDELSFGKHLSLMGVIGQVSIYLDKLLVFQFNSGAILAAYYLAMTPFKQIQTLLGGINTLALPKFSQNTLENIRKTLLHKIAKLYLIIIPIIIAYFLSADFIFEKIYPQYLSAVFISKIFMLQLLFFPTNMIGTVFTAHSQQKNLYIASTSYAIIRIILILILTPIFGIYGAVSAILITGFINSIINLYLFLKK